MRPQYVFPEKTGPGIPTRGLAGEWVAA
jgi:hypothetical protein